MHYGLAPVDVAKLQLGYLPGAKAHLDHAQSHREVSGPDACRGVKALEEPSESFLVQMSWNIGQSPSRNRRNRMEKPTIDESPELAEA